jgi:hypothetical protein
MLSGTVLKLSRSFFELDDDELRSFDLFDELFAESFCGRFDLLNFIRLFWNQILT